MNSFLHKIYKLRLDSYTFNLLYCMQVFYPWPVVCVFTHLYATSIAIHKPGYVYITHGAWSDIVICVNYYFKVVNICYSYSNSLIIPIGTHSIYGRYLKF